jgi:prolyl oligopeptidase
LVLYAYGGFGESTLPSFAPENMMLMNNLGGIFCVANIRGGGEYGDKWHTEGNLEKKQNSFDDFIYAA